MDPIRTRQQWSPMLGRYENLPTPIRPKSPTLSRLGKAATVLVIDDEPAVAASTKMLLKLEGYRVEVAAGMEQAVARWKTADAWLDVIVADYHLADGNSGIDVIERLRTLSRRSVPAVLVTGDSLSDASIALANLDGCEVLSKPFVPSHFLKVVSQLASSELQKN